MLSQRPSGDLPGDLPGGPRKPHEAPRNFPGPAPWDVSCNSKETSDDICVAHILPWFLEPPGATQTPKSYDI